MMVRKIHKAEEIVPKLRQVDVLTAQGQSVADAVRSTGLTEVTYSLWRQEFGGLKSDQMKRLKDFETENARLRKFVRPRSVSGSGYGTCKGFVVQRAVGSPISFVGESKSGDAMAERKRTHLERTRPHFSSSTKNTILAAFRNVMKVARDEGVIDHIPDTPRTRRGPITSSMCRVADW
jgi:putative transposase